MISSTHCIFLGAVLNVVASVTPNNESRYACKEVPRARNGLCADHFGEETWYGRFPNARGLDLDDSIVEFFHFFALLYQDNYCSLMLFKLLCFHYFPLCSSECPDIGVTPCRQVCTEAVEACLPYARVLYGKMFDNSFPQYLNCSCFANVNSEKKECRINASSSSNSNGPSSSNEEVDHLECPNATIHIDFSPPTGSRSYQVMESAGSVEICLVLANTGSYDHTSALSVPVTLKFSATQTKTSFLPHATLDDDYAEPVASLTIPSGSVRGIEVAIVDDYLKEGRESFSVEAALLSPVSANIGSSRAQSSTSSVEVIIVDDDEPFIPQDECKSRCSIRSRANSNTFTQNSYTYAAHIEVLERRDSTYSSLLDVVILECWELEPIVCPQSHSKYSIPVCRDCDLGFNDSEEYLIAGRHVQDTLGNGLYLPNYRKGGLFAPWKKSYSSVSEWVLRAAND